MRQPSQPASFQAELSTPQSVARSGPRPIRQRQLAKALSRDGGFFAVAGTVAVAGENMDVDVQPPVPPPDSPMECDTAAADAGLVPPGCRVQTAAHPPADVAMDCDCPPLAHTDAPEPDVAQHGTSSPPPLELCGVAITRIEECFSWIAGHTDFDTAQARAAICALYARCCRQSTGKENELLICLYGADSSPQDSYGSPPLTDAELRELFTPEEPEAAPAQQLQLTPAIPPGLEERADAIQTAQQAAKDALAGITPRRRSSRPRQQRTDWWMPQQPPKPPPQEHRDRKPQKQEHRNRKPHQTEGAPARRPSQP
ncbi:hypothetical protein COCOBI_17-1990 [Coccomyxa sp. Obi]|nr:hypothetical protein COCOBI_17-1990 [Coccomyxa sp. Obi]